MNLLHQIQDRIRSALAGMTDDVEPFVAMVRPTQDAKHGDYQANCSMSLSKKLGSKPRDVAQAIVDKLSTGDLLEKPEIAGPGFINLKLKPAGLAPQLQAMAKSDRLAVAPASPPRRFVIDFSSPNVAKPMHVGHVRSTIIGDSLTRLLRFLGHAVVSDNHLGDWGTQFGMILWGWKNHRDEDAYQNDPVGELARLYRLAAGKIKHYEKHGKNVEKIQTLQAQGKTQEANDILTKVIQSEKDCEGKPLAEIVALVEDGKKVDIAARTETAKLHAGDAENRALWKQFIPHCLDALKGIYQRLDVTFDEWLGESAYDEMLPAVVKDLQAKGLLVESQGALVVFVPGMEAPFMVRKSDGAFNYATSDLATIQYRKEHFDPNVLLYVVDHRQGDHFKALFEVAKMWGYTDMQYVHVAFGTIMGKDNKPYRTREGDVVGLESLLNDAMNEAKAVVDQESPDLDETQRRNIAEVVGIGAVKYADLSQNRTSNYVFDLKKMVAMNGNTATYMQYAFARNRSIFRKAEVQPEPYRTNPPLPILETEFERNLAVQLLRLEEVLLAAAEDYQPSVITSYLWDLAKTYSGFFQNCPVIKAPSPELRESRLLLCDLTARVLQTCLGLLGIRTVERM